MKKFITFVALLLGTLVYSQGVNGDYLEMPQIPTASQGLIPVTADKFQMSYNPTTGQVEYRVAAGGWIGLGNASSWSTFNATQTVNMDNNGFSNVGDSFFVDSTTIDATTSPTGDNLTLKGSVGDGTVRIFVDYNGNGSGFTNLNMTATDILYNGQSLISPSGIEGVDVVSSGETGGDKFLREDGDNTSSWQYITTQSVLNGTLLAEDLADDAVTEPKIDSHNAPSDGQVRYWDSALGMGWKDEAGGGDLYLHPFSVEQIDSLYVGPSGHGRPLGTDVLEINTDVKIEYTKEVPLGAVGHDVATGTDLTFVSFDEAITITSVSASVKTAGTTSVITYDINLDDGTPASILSTKLTIDATERFSSTAATAPVISDATIPADSFLTFDCDTADSGDTGADGTIIIKYTVD